MKKSHFRRDSSGLSLNPEINKKESYVIIEDGKKKGVKRKKKHKTKKDKYFGRKLVRLCPHCYKGEIEKIVDFLYNPETGKKSLRRVWYKCKTCGGVYRANDMINVHRAPGEGPKAQKKMTVKEYNRKLEEKALCIVSKYDIQTH